MSEKHFEQAYQIRQSAASLLASRGAAAAPGPVIDSKYLLLAPGASDARASPGTRLTILVDVTPKPKIHVYAPGQPDYMPISLTLEQDAAYAAAGEPRYPRPERFYFKPLKETFLVYSKPFRIAQDVVIPASQDMRGRAKTSGAAVVVKGKVAYQACDDAVCYLPVEVPVSWTVALTPLK